MFVNEQIVILMMALLQILYMMHVMLLNMVILMEINADGRQEANIARILVQMITVILVLGLRQTVENCRQQAHQAAILTEISHTA